VCNTNLAREPAPVVVPEGAAEAGPADHTEISIQPDGEEYAPPEPEHDEEPEPAPEERIDRGGPYCPACGESNFPDRKFCMSCGESFQVHQAPPRERWWRRIADRHRARIERGRKPRRGRSLGRLFRRTVLLLLVAAALFGVLGPFRAEVRGAAADAYWKVRHAVEQATDRQAAETASARTIASYSRWVRAAAT
jgi:hypothetical protein